jgi:uncharacterized protein DUF4054
MSYLDVTSEDVTDRFPALAGRETELDNVLPEAKRSVSADWDPDDAVDAVKYLAAHMLLTEDTADELATVGESLGPISTSYRPPNDDGSGLEMTEYGRRYVKLRRRNFPGIVVAPATR